MSQDGDDFFGMPAVEASRLCAAARGGQVLASDVVRLLVGWGGMHQLEPLARIELKGIPERLLLNLKLGLLERKLTASEDEGLVAELRAELDRAVSELRDLVHGIYPQVLTSDGVGAALADAAPDAVVEADRLGRHAPEVEAAVYFCCLEALQNAGKYAADAQVRVTLADGDGRLEFAIADDVPGFEVTSVNGSSGLQNIRDRVGALGGEVEIRSRPGAGTSVVGFVPVAR